MAHDLPHSGPEGQAEMLAYAVVFGELKGGEFDWGHMEWKKQDKGR